MELVAFVGALAALGVLALCFGADSRDLAGGGPWHNWREAAATRGIAVASMVDPSGTGVEASHRVGELRATAARERLLRRPAAVRLGPAPHRAALGWAGARLVRVGRRLESYGEASRTGSLLPLGEG
jgi:hypothetical protein